MNIPSLIPLKILPPLENIFFTPFQALLNMFLKNVATDEKIFLIPFQAFWAPFFIVFHIPLNRLAKGLITALLNQVLTTDHIDTIISQAPLNIALIVLNKPVNKEATASIIPPKKVFKPSQALLQSPVNTPVIKSITPLSASMIPPIIPHKPSITGSSTFIITSIIVSIIGFKNSHTEPIAIIILDIQSKTLSTTGAK